jgi:hypothetical protein
MNINFNFALKKGLYPDDILTLMLVKYCSYKENNPDENIVKMLSVRSFANVGEYITVSSSHKMRLNKAGTELLNKLTSMREELKTDEDKVILQYIVDYCNKNEDLIIGNRQQILRSLVEIRLATGFSAQAIFTIMKHFLSSEDANFFKKFDYLFWKPSSPYDKKFKLDNCRLYTYYEKNKEELDSILTKLQPA